MAAWWPSTADEKLSVSNRGPGMPTIVFASSKGGAGKSTAAVLLATQLAERGAEVTLIDADTNRHVAVWASKPRRPPNITVVADITEQTVIRQIDDAARQTASSSSTSRAPPRGWSSTP